MSKVTEEVEAEVYEPTEANDELDLDDFSKKSPESISKQKKSIQKNKHAQMARPEKSITTTKPTTSNFESCPE